jgi:hypothetical protein
MILVAIAYRDNIFLSSILLAQSDNLQFAMYSVLATAVGWCAIYRDMYVWV